MPDDVRNTITHILQSIEIERFSLSIFRQKIIREIIPRLNLEQYDIYQL